MPCSLHLVDYFDLDGDHSAKMICVPPFLDPFGRRSAAKLLARDDAQICANNIAKLPEVAKTLLWPSAIIPSISAIYPSVGLLFGGRGSL